MKRLFKGEAYCLTGFGIKFTKRNTASAALWSVCLRAKPIVHTGSGIMRGIAKFKVNSLNSMSSTDKNEIKILHQLLVGRSALPFEEVFTEAEAIADEDLKAVYSDVLVIRDILRLFAGGNFDVDIQIRGAVAGYLKTLQANLRHLAWQVEQVAIGDFSQRVDFMGNFSRAFNSMVTQLYDFRERAAEERTQIMLDATPLCVSFWDENINLIDCNLEAVKLFGLRYKQEFVERFMDEFSPEHQPNGMSSIPLMKEKLRTAFETGHVVFEWMYKTAAGELLPSEVTLVRVERKGVFMVVGYIRDLRELKKAQFALEQERILLLDVLNSSPVCFSIVVDGKIRYSTPFMQDFLGVNGEEDMSDFFQDRNNADMLFKELLENKIIHWRDVSMRTKSGEPKEMLANLFYTDYYMEKGAMVWLVDVTQIRKVQHDLQNARNVAEDLARLKNEFLANVSHEIRTPMNAILGIANLILNTQLDGKQRELVTTMEKSAKKLLVIINDILDFAKLEAGKLTMQLREFSPTKVINEVVDEYRTEIEGKGLQFAVDVDSGLPEKVVGDDSRLKQVLDNLLSNALKFTESGTITLNARATDALESSIIPAKSQEANNDENNADDNSVSMRFVVSDTGSGMTEKELRQLFTPFTQADSSSTREYGGTGLGLSITKSLIEAMHGNIKCESHRGRGSTFKFTTRFPLPNLNADVCTTRITVQAAQKKNETTANEEVEKKTPDVVIPENLRGILILLVEDNKINQLVATELLRQKGFEVDVASNGKIATEMVRLRDYKLVFMDIQMPEMDGFQATEAIRKDPKFANLPILAMTAHAMAGYKEQCIAAGMNDHITKPIDPTVLYKSIIQWAKIN
ncbi:MAG: response regulator [Planctomycetaceae bacterium]|nr:response regulator [Planctomycetaceae bacterium]